MLNSTNTLIKPPLHTVLDNWSEFVTSDEIHVRSRTEPPFLSDTVRSRRPSFFGHLHQNHHRALQACISGPPGHMSIAIGDGGSVVQSNLGLEQCDQWILTIAKWRAQNRSSWRKLVATATSSHDAGVRLFVCPCLSQHELLPCRGRR